MRRHVETIGVGCKWLRSPHGEIFCYSLALISNNTALSSAIQLSISRVETRERAVSTLGLYNLLCYCKFKLEIGRTA